MDPQLQRIAITFRGGNYIEFRADESTLAALLRDWREWRLVEAKKGEAFDPLRRYTLHTPAHASAQEDFDLILDITMLTSVGIFSGD